MVYRVLVLAATLLVAACGPATQSGSEGVAEGTPGVSAQAVIFGSQTDLSGPLADEGAGAIDGARMRFDEVNEAGGIHGRRIRLIVDDTGSHVASAVSSVKKLIDKDHVFAMFLSLGMQTDNAALAEQQKAGVPNMFPMSGSRLMVDPVSELKFTSRPTYGDEIRAGVTWFVGHESKHTPCVVYEDTGYGHEVLDGARDQLKKMGHKLALAEMQSAGHSDADKVLSKLQAKACDVVFLGLARQGVVDVLKAAKKQHDTATTFVGTDANYDQAFMTLAGDSAEGLYVLTPMATLYNSDDMPPKVRLWWTNYTQEFGVAPRLDAMEGYRNADLLMRALQAAGAQPTRKSLIKATEAIKDYTGPFGYHLSFGPNKHQGTRASVLSTLTNGKWKVVEKSIDVKG